VEEWWTAIALAHDGQRKTMASLLMLVTWGLWKERNARTFNNVSTLPINYKKKSTLPIIIFQKIKSEARTWVLAGAKFGSLNFGRIDLFFLSLGG
jgi:hypothetical protein